LVAWLQSLPIQKLRALSLFIAIPNAQAHVGSKFDLNDSPSPLDIRSGAFFHSESRLGTAMQTYGRWRASMLFKPNTDVYFIYDSKGGPKFDYFVWVHYEGGRLVAKLRRVVGEGSVYMQMVPVVKEGKWLYVDFRKRAIGASGFVRWGVLTSFKSQTFCKNECWDGLPNRGMVTHDLRT